MIYHGIIASARLKIRAANAVGLLATIATGAVTGSAEGGIVSASKRSLMAAAGPFSVSTSNAMTYFEVHGGIRERTTLPERTTLRLPAPGVMRKARVYVSANARTSPTMLILSKNLTNTSIQVYIPAGQTGWFEDVDNEVTTAAGDDFNWVLQTAAGGGTLTITAAVVEFDANTAITTLYAKNCNPDVNLALQTGTYHTRLTSYGRNTIPSWLSGTSEKMFTELHAAGTLSHARLRIHANSRTTDTVFKLQKGVTDTGIQITVPAGQAGVFEDTVNTVSVTPGDTFRWITSYDTTAELRAQLLSIAFTASANKWDLITENSDGFTSADGALADNYILPTGALRPRTAEPSNQLKTSFGMSISNLRVTGYYNAGTGSLPFDLKFRSNSVDTDLKVTLAANTASDSAQLLNSTDTAGVNADDLFNYTFKPLGGSAGLNGPYAVGVTVQSGDGPPPSPSTSRKVMMTPEIQPPQGATVYGSLIPGHVGSSVNTEAQVQTAAPTDGVFRKLSFTILALFGPSNVTTVRLRVNGANSPVGVSCPAGVLGLFEDATNAAPVKAGDLISISAQGSGAPYTATMGSSAAIEFETAAANPVTIYGMGLLDNVVAGTNYFSAFGGDSAAGPYASVETVQQNVVRAPGVLSNFRLWMRANPNTASISVRLRKNEADTPVVLSIPATTSGYFEDVTNTVAVASGDRMNWQIDTTAGNTGVRLQFIQCTFTADSGKTDIFMSFRSGANNMSSTPRFKGLGTRLNVAQFSLANEQPTKVPFAADLSHLRVRVGAGSALPISVRLRINDVPGAQSVTIPGSTTGFFEDVTNIDKVAAGSLVAVEYVTNGSSMRILTTELTVDSRPEVI